MTKNRVCVTKIVLKSFQPNKQFRTKRSISLLITSTIIKPSSVIVLVRVPVWTKTFPVGSVASAGVNAATIESSLADIVKTVTPESQASSTAELLNVFSY